MCVIKQNDKWVYGAQASSSWCAAGGRRRARGTPSRFPAVLECCAARRPSFCSSPRWALFRPPREPPILLHAAPPLGGIRSPLPHRAQALRRTPRAARARRNQVDCGVQGKRKGCGRLVVLLHRLAIDIHKPPGRDEQHKLWIGACAAPAGVPAARGAGRRAAAGEQRQHNTTTTECREVRMAGGSPALTSIAADITCLALFDCIDVRMEVSA